MSEIEEKIEKSMKCKRKGKMESLRNRSLFEVKRIQNRLDSREEDFPQRCFLRVGNLNGQKQRNNCCFEIPIRV